MTIYISSVNIGKIYVLLKLYVLKYCTLIFCKLIVLINCLDEICVIA